MAEESIFTCDFRGKKVPELGPILVIQDIRKKVISEKAYDLCSNCHSELKTYIKQIRNMKMGL